MFDFASTCLSPDRYSFETRQNRSRADLCLVGGGYLADEDNDRIRLTKAWADTLNGPSATGNSTTLADLFYNYTWTGEGGISSGPLPKHTAMPSWILTDALGRIGYDLAMSREWLVCSDTWCSSGSLVDEFLHWRGLTSWGATFFNGTADELGDILGQDVSHGMPDGKQILESFPKPRNFTTAWTKVSFLVHRYGYRWGFNNTITEVAAAILILHALIAIAHCIHLLIVRKPYDFADSIMDLLALAVTSKPPDVLETFDDKPHSLWSQPTVYREAQEHKGQGQRGELVLGRENLKKRDRRRGFIYEDT